MDMWIWIAVLVVGVPVVFFATYKLANKGNRTWWSNINAGIFSVLGSVVPVLINVDWGSFASPIAVAFIVPVLNGLNMWIRTKTTTPIGTDEPTADTE